MNRNHAIDLARTHALVHGLSGDHAYLPTTDAEAAEWLPHAWVVGAIVESAACARDQAADDAACAARYRWLRDHADDENDGDSYCTRILFETAPEGWDAAIDAAIASEPATCAKCGYRVCHADCGAEDYEVGP